MRMQSEMAISENRRKDLAILVGLILFALVSRGYGLAQWDFVVDEYYTVYEAEQRYKSLTNPAYYALVLGSFKLFGVTEWSARLPAMVLGVLAVPIFYLTWRNVLGRNVALIGALLIIFSSWHLWYSQYSRFYSGVFLFGSLSYFFYYRAIRLDSVRYLLWAMLANVVGFLFHATFILVPVSCAVFSVIVLLWRQSRIQAHSARVAKMHVALVGAAGLIAMPFLWDLGELWYRSEQLWGSSPSALALQITKYVQIPVALSAFFGVILFLQKHRLEAIFFGIGAGVPILVLVIGSTFVAVRPDYIFYILPVVFLLAALLCEEVRLALAHYRIAAHALTLTLIVSMFPEMISHYTGRKSLDIRDTVAFVENVYQPGDRVLSFVAGFDHYSQNKYPMARRPGNPYDNGKAWAQVLQPYVVGAGRLWIVLPATRNPLANGLEGWLRANASLAWRKYEKRYDYTVKGYQIFVAGTSSHSPSDAEMGQSTAGTKSTTGSGLNTSK
jgi:4-amino-4-deoxy-L-arabinose transferase-like glycosyltransferase